MKLQCKYSGIVYDAEIFDGTQLNALHIEDKDPHTEGMQIEADSPSGDKVVVMLALGQLVLRDPEGRVTVAHASLIGQQFEEVQNG